MKLEQPQSIRTIFFDAGFTLLHPSPSILVVCQQVCQQYGLHVDLNHLQQGIEGAKNFHFRQFQSNRYIWANEQAITEFWFSYYRSFLQPLVAELDEKYLDQLIHAIAEEFEKHTTWQLYPDVKPTLEAFRAKGYSLGVISDWNIALGPLLRLFDLTQYFDCLIISAVARHAKPSPTLYDMALERANAIPDYTIHIGDSYIHDVLGARSVGITPILLDRADTLTENKVDCLLVHSLYELLDLLEISRP
ncbi:MAG TPA: HAD-IA family hydrolase [Ktedonobacteraceae bacterium]|jgi:REG-2-like HAD superfamily hydrolase